MLAPTISRLQVGTIEFMFTRKHFHLLIVHFVEHGRQSGKDSWTRRCGRPTIAAVNVSPPSWYHRHQSHTSKFSNTFYCERHKGEVYIAQQDFTLRQVNIYIMEREVEVKLDSEVKQNIIPAFIRD